jgi:iron complex transport system substrate-binding protein
VPAASVDERRRPRVVSLLPSATELVCAVGGTGDLVGVSHECDFPEEVRRLPVLTSARIGALPSSLAIDASVRAVIRDALSIYSIDEQKLAELRPDVIVTQDLCEVCAVSLNDVRGAVARLAKHESVRIVSLRPTRLSHVFADVESVANALGRSEAGTRVRAELEMRTRAIALRAEQVRFRPRVVSIEWLEPLMLGGTWMPELIELAGGLAVGAHAGEAAPTVSPAELSALAPDVVLVKPCGFTIERTLREREIVEHDIAHAVGPSARIYVSDGNAFFNRPGPRLVESLEILGACVHPDLFSDFAAKHERVLCVIRSSS